MRIFNHERLISPSNVEQIFPRFGLMGLNLQFASALLRSAGHATDAIWLILYFYHFMYLFVIAGAEQIQWSTLFSFSHESWLTLTASRIPRLITIVLTGIGLAVCGVILQHIVRNKFVEPETSGGLDAAKLGILVSLTLVPVTSTLSKMIFAIIFCFIASLIYIAIIRRIRFRNMVLVPVIGLMYGSVLSALAEFLCLSL